MVNDDRAPEARGATTDTIPRSYWYSWEFIGTFIAIILAKDAGSGGFSLAAPVLNDINREIGPDPDITWVSLAWTLTQGISTLIVGRLSDVFGRRWIFVSASALGTAGAIWASQATSVKQLIGATVLLGLAGGVQISYFWIISEIVPMRWRFIANAILYVFSFTSWLGPKISYDFFTETDVGWRGSYYLLVALNGLSTICWWAFYHPPTFKMLHRRQALFKLLLSFDWLGLLLYTASFTCFLIGLNWGGNKYPWGSAEVLGTMISGLVGLFLFIGFEMWLPSYTKAITPFVEIHFFTNLPLMAITGMTCVAGSTYYGWASVWPGLVSNVWTDLSHDRTGDMLSLFVLCYVWSQAAGGFVAHFAGAKIPICVTIIVATPLLGALATDPFNMILTCILMALGSFSLGIMEGIALTATTYPLRSQEEIGSAGGLTGTIRLFFSTIATAVYNTVIRNRLNTTIPANVGPAATEAGLPSSSLDALITNLREGLPLNNSTLIPGVNGAVEEAARLAYRIAYSQAYRTVFLVCIAFTVPGCLLCWFVVDADEKKDTFIAGHLHKRGDKKRLEEQEG
ncbi:fungal trichothecene efflux pump [Aspergillus pseudoustus]|uniref:Fungal trichothecene efflux pump n=1 Tax=Aspergillus pseudoustus TaxID=1810923 RepID=A0ABR4IBJ8_9EURO